MRPWKQKGVLRTKTWPLWSQLDGDEVEELERDVGSVSDLAAEALATAPQRSVGSMIAGDQPTNRTQYSQSDSESARQLGSASGVGLPELGRISSLRLPNDFNAS